MRAVELWRDLSHECPEQARYPQPALLTSRIHQRIAAALAAEHEILIEIVAQVIAASAGAVTPARRFGAEGRMPAYRTITPGTYRSASPVVLAFISSRNCR
jgi:hypothetical protein